jgi:microcystin-dependent protein
VGIPRSAGDDAMYKNEITVNSFSKQGGLNSAPGIYLRVGEESKEALEDEVIRIGKVIVTNDTSGTTSPTVPHRQGPGRAKLLETGEMWLRTTDQAFFVHDGTKYLRVTPLEATEEVDGTIRIATENEVLSATSKLTAVTPSYLESWKNERELVSRNHSGTTIYVDQAIGDDSLENDGRDPRYPFLTIERALLEAALSSYVADTQEDEDNDRFQEVSILLRPGDYFLDNRPGAPNLENLFKHDFGNVGPINPIDSEATVTAIEPQTGRVTLSTSVVGQVFRHTQIYNTSGGSAIIDAFEEDNVIIVRSVRGAWGNGDAVIYSDYSVFNPPTGGVIVPRGVSIIGQDLAKCSVRPRYLGDFEKWEESLGPCSCSEEGTTSRFKLTGSSYIANITLKDNPLKRETHHLCVGFSFASTSDLSNPDYGYYSKVGAGLGRTISPDFDAASFTSVALETSIAVLEAGKEDRDSDGFLNVNNIVGTSPYLSNCSLVSRFGACGLKIDGALVEGFKSMTIEKYTNISTQEDERAFLEATTAQDIRIYKEAWRHTGIEATNDGFGQILSSFTVCAAEHYRVKSGGELSLANCFTNFGETAFSAEGHSLNPMPQDTGFTISRFIPPLPLDTNEVKYTLGTLAGVNGTLRLLFSEALNLSSLSPYIVESGDKLYVDGDDGAVYTATATGNFGVESDGTHYAQVETEENLIAGQIQNLAGKRVYFKRLPDQRNNQQKIFWLELSGITSSKRLPPQSYVLRLDDYSNLEPISIVEVTSTAPDGSAAPSGSCYLGVMKASSIVEKPVSLYPNSDPNEPDDNPPNSLTYLAVKAILQAIGVNEETSVTYTTPQTEPQTIKNLQGESVTLRVSFTKPSTIRAFNTTTEWIGYGNYDTGLLKYQDVSLTKEEERVKLKRETKGGKIYHTGMNHNGTYIMGDKYINLLTGEEESLSNDGSIATQRFNKMVVSSGLDVAANATLDLSRSTILIDNETRFSYPIPKTAQTYASVTQPGFIQIAEPTDFDSSNLAATPAQVKTIKDLYTELAEQRHLYAEELLQALSARIDELVGVGGLPESQVSTGGAVPIGGIIMWSGDIDAIPVGYYLCDGENNTPDLRNRFIIGAGGSYGLTATGGEQETRLTKSHLPSHGHELDIAQEYVVGVKYPESFAPGDLSQVPAGQTLALVASLQVPSLDTEEAVTVITETEGENEPITNLPPYYALAYIMRYA